MDSYKVCPTCKKENSISEMLCYFCMADISSIKPVENTTKELIVEDDDKTIIENNYLVLNLSNSEKITVKDGDFVGRNYIGAEYLKIHKTLSRKHAQFTFQNGKWFVEDLDTTNGIYIQGQRIKPSIKTQIKNGQKLSLSNSVETIVFIAGEF